MVPTPQARSWWGGGGYPKVPTIQPGPNGGYPKVPTPQAKVPIPQSGPDGGGGGVTPR